MKTYYAVYGDEGVAVGLPYTTSIKMPDAPLDAFMPSTVIHRLYGVSAVYLLDTDTGFILRRPVLAYKEDGSYKLQVGGIERDATVKFPTSEGVGNDFKIIWQSSKSIGIDGNMIFFDASAFTMSSIMSYNGTYDLCLMAYLHNKMDSVRSFKYFLAKKSKVKRKLISEGVHLHPFLRCYCDTLARLQKRAALFDDDVSDIGELITMQLLNELNELSDDVIASLPCPVALQSLQRYATSMDSLGKVYGVLDRVVSYLNDAYAFCFDIGVDDIELAEKVEYPFLFTVIDAAGNSDTKVAELMKKPSKLLGRVRNRCDGSIISF